MKYRSFSLVILSVIFLLAGCNSHDELENLDFPLISSEYPVTTIVSHQSSYPIVTKTITSIEITQFATQDPSLGTVKGVLLLNGEPLRDVTLYLGQIITDYQGRELVAGYDRTSLLRGNTNIKGEFTIYNVPVGRYGLILDLVTQAYLLDAPDGTQSILFSVGGSEITDLGVFDYKYLPGF